MELCIKAYLLDISDIKIACLLNVASIRENLLGVEVRFKLI